MVEVFITNILTKIQGERISKFIQKAYSDLKINYDLNETDFPFPCGHTILRIEGNNINSDKIMMIVRKQDFDCEILEDKICIKKEEI